MERFIVAFSITTVVIAIGYAGSAATTARPHKPAAVVRQLDAKALLKKLETLDARLSEAQTNIDEVLKRLANVSEESQRDATRVRLDVLFALERGLTADIERTRQALAQVSAR